jgi:hyperosmotically inducible protein
MNKWISFTFVAALGACASDSAQRRPAASMQTEPAPRHERIQGRHTEPAVQLAPDPTAPGHSAARDDTHDTHDTPGARTEVAPTPLAQGNNSSDLENTRKIRKAVMADDQLSFAAKNVKIISEQGQVTLRGDVKNAAERRAIASYAAQVVGEKRVHDELNVQP